MRLPHLYTIRPMNDVAAHINPIIPPAAAAQCMKHMIAL